MKISELSIEHDYYCEEGPARDEFQTWSEFIKEYNDTRDCYNLLFRWDIREREADDSEPLEGYEMLLFYMVQRKGYIYSVIINKVTDEDAESIKEWLSARFFYLKELWQPIN